MQAQGVREVIVERNDRRERGRAGRAARAGRGQLREPGPLPNTEIDRAPAGPADCRWWPRSRAIHRSGTRSPTARSTSRRRRTIRTSGFSGGSRTPANRSWARAAPPGTTSGPRRRGATRRAAGVTVAVVDTGADPTAPDLAGQTVAGQSFLGGVQGTPTPDQNGHGTFVSGRHRGHP